MTIKYYYEYYDSRYDNNLINGIMHAKDANEVLNHLNKSIYRTNVVISLYCPDIHDSKLFGAMRDSCS